MQPATGRGGKTDAAALIRHIGALEHMELVALRREWIRVLKTSPHLRYSADLLRRGIAHRLHEAAYGRCAQSTLRRLTATCVTPSSKPAGVALKAGTTLVREWYGHTHTVRVLEDGFEYGGRRYASLTGIAREITGAAWSGPRFFGLAKASPINRLTSKVDHA